MKSVLIFLASAVLAFGDSALTFTDNRLVVDAPADATRVSADFVFKNTTERTIKITKMDAPCSCLSAALVPARLLKDGIAPGESGTVRGKFELGSFKGEVTKSIALWTDEGEKDASIFLETVVRIPVLFDIQPKTLTWDLGAEGEKKSFLIKVNGDEQINILSHKGTNDDFPYEIKTVRPGWEYEVIVDPANVKDPGIGIITFQTDAKIPKHKRQQAFVVVRKPRVKKS